MFDELMEKIKRKWVFFSILIWLLLCQVIFLFVQQGIAEKVIETLRVQFKQDASFSNFHFISKNIISFSKFGAIKCAVLKSKHPLDALIIDLRYMDKKCNAWDFSMDGKNVLLNLETINGDVYELRFYSSNPSVFYISLWGFRFLGCLLIVLGFKIMTWKNQAQFIKWKMDIESAHKLNELALQVSHDMRSPLAVLKSMAPKFAETLKLDLDEKMMIQQSIDRIDDIAHQLLSKNRMDKVQFNVDQAVFQMIEKILAEKRIEFKPLKIDMRVECLKSDQDLKAQIDPTKFQCIISNLLNNARDALIQTSVPLINVKIFSDLDDKLVITIEDNGCGIPSSVLKSVGQRGFSFGKDNYGNGLGLSHAIETIRDFGGTLLINSVEGKGTVVRIELKIKPDKLEFIDRKNKDQPIFVLVDDDELISLHWSMIAKNKGVRLMTYNHAQKLLEQIHLFSEQTIFYIDVECGAEKGEDLAIKLSKLQFKNIYLTTGHSAELFGHLSFLSGVIGKDAPF